MKRITRGAVGIEQGSHVLFSDFADGGAMWTGQGPRESRFSVTFPQPFAEPPSVMVGLSMWDIDRSQNSRVDIAAEAISETGFQIVFRTWGDTRVARVRADWTAIGAIADDDHWILD